MKNQSFELRSRSDRAVVIAGSFAPNGSSAVSASSREGCGFTVARTSAGLFTITLADKFTALISATATTQLATAADMTAQVGDVDLSAKTIQVRTLVGATETDIAADAGNRVNFVLVLNSSNASRRRGD